MQSIGTQRLQLECVQCFMPIYHLHKAICTFLPDSRLHRHDNSNCVLLSTTKFFAVPHLIFISACRIFAVALYIHILAIFINAFALFINTFALFINILANFVNALAHFINALAHLINTLAYLINIPAHLINAPAHLINTSAQCGLIQFQVWTNTILGVD